MSSSTHGLSTSTVEVTHISSHGVWLLANGRELFLAYDEFPWFKDVELKKIFNVQLESAGHFYWPDLDVDLSDKILRNPEKFQLVSKA